MLLGLGPRVARQVEQPGARWPHWSSGSLNNESLASLDSEIRHFIGKPEARVANGSALEAVFALNRGPG